MNRKQAVRSLAAAVLLAAGVPAAWSQSADTYPNKPIKFIVGYAPGGGNDLLARIVAQKMQEGLGQPVIVENRPSNAAIIGTLAVAKAAPDGYTLAVGASGPFVFNAALYSKLPYDARKEFAPISLIGTFPLLLMVQGTSPYKSVADLVAFTKASPEQSNYGASAASFRLATELLKAKTGIKGDYIPYKGSAETIQAVAAGQLTMTLVDTGPAAGALKGGLLRALAVTSPKRLPAYPDVPTMSEQGIDLTIQLWTGLLAPAGTPDAIVRKLNAEVQRILKLPDVRERILALNIEPQGSTPEQMTQLIAREIELWSGVAQANKISAD
jgi:tripartite-type tricarboxylate transporter receptor subunit TctC